MDLNKRKKKEKKQSCLYFSWFLTVLNSKVNLLTILNRSFLALEDIAKISLKNKNKESTVWLQDNKTERRWVCLVKSEWWWNGVLEGRWKEESIRQGEGWGIYFEVKKPQNFEQKIYKQRTTSWTGPRIGGKQSHVSTIPMHIIINC